MSVLTGNKGEWSEFYALLKLLAEGKLFAADADLNKLENLYYPIIKIINPTDTKKAFHIDSCVKIKNSETEEVIAEIPIKYIADTAKLTLDKIKASTGTFEIPELQDMFDKLQMTTFKANSTNKTDITMVLHDVNTGIEPEVGFSIKSNLGSAPTLINASAATNFTYKLIGELTSEEVAEVNSIDTNDKIIGRMNWLEDHGIKLEFEAVDNSFFGSNLFLIDSNLPKIVAECLLLYYARKCSPNLIDIVEKLEDDNPLNFPTNLNFYSYKLKKLLTASALGLLPSRPWNGEFEISGGYIVVKLDGEVVCYHLYNLNQFENYIIHNTKFETGSTTRHGFASVYRDDTNALKLKLNLQVRFTN